MAPTPSVTPVALKHWLWASRDLVVETLGLPPTWWPTTQASASTWAAAFFLTASLSFVDTERLSLDKLSVSAAWRKNDSRRKVVDKILASKTRELRLQEVLVDFSVHDWEGDVFVATGESEVHAYHGVGDMVDSCDDYSWDFFKLLAVPSPLRLFFARVGTTLRQVPVADRLDELEESLKHVSELYGSRLLREKDQLGCVLIGATKEAARSSRVLHLSGGRLQTSPFDDKEAFPPLRKRDLRAASSR